MKKRKKIDAQKVMLPHSQAKLDFYKDYLKRYIPILRLANFTTSINIFDVFCGTGIYENGAKGSPILAFEAIKESSKNISGFNKQLTPINLFINDLKTDKVEQVKQYLQNKTVNNNQIYELTLRNMYLKKHANEILRNLQKRVSY